jgi:hypothetical protein
LSLWSIAGTFFVGSVNAAGLAQGFGVEYDANTSCVFVVVSLSHLNSNAIACFVYPNALVNDG